MLGLVDRFSDKWLAFLWEQTVPHYWLTCFSIPMKMSFWKNSLRKAKESLLESPMYSTYTERRSASETAIEFALLSLYHIITLMTLSITLSIIKILRSSFLIFTPKELTVSETTESTSVASYLDLLITRDKSNNITAKLYARCDAFGFHIVNFPFMLSNISSAPACGVYASQLIRYARCCSNYSNFFDNFR